MPGTAARFKRAVPFLWVIGRLDPLYPAGGGFACARALPHPLSRCLVVRAGHMDTPKVAMAKVLEWVKQVIAHLGNEASASVSSRASWRR